MYMSSPQPQNVLKPCASLHRDYTSLTNIETRITPAAARPPSIPPSYETISLSLSPMRRGTAVPMHITSGSIPHHPVLLRPRAIHLTDSYLCFLTLHHSTYISMYNFKSVFPSS